MYKCNHCKKEFEETKVITTTYEYYYGVSHLFEDSHIMSYEVCPYCHSEDFDEIEGTYDN